MEVQLSAVFGILIIVLVTFVLYKVGKSRSNKLLKYIPSIACLVGIGVFYFKLNFISVGLEGILDIIMMIFLAITFGLSLVIALVMEFVERRGKFK
ncbi:dolichyl-phosphate-mannose--protein O-mannosyl transferase [Evansella vedderi]|uniref:Dolichyl-phosphate-mannose--protein O-mannosyl transferase n=1 Tax=Evansella vedderi TaxID=38282 RepID=A0ABU0A171_9BACI|nr:hypothetical protein [Evansella vedderi]MDQ0257236.1 dolichyl-phosphate-mannose--protein O-mannosyl transferase [Evansella vedderi]